ncbi:phospholipase C, phosphocholine-specific [Cytophagaceae bacterium YF14B1]|uniref:phospholipase C n=1 Tax=Xanthocytophaga flava TaxID=3048013 RepID=A0AAE3QVD7_9BACT|nr:phospholipase C, phosphocholine-specific [Xanthocytophaga flavus]MDJ1486060.1 phospholipase C, phosphocholine-specific [Xanthocytophaga flavus]
MDTRREFLKKAALLSGGAGLWSALPASIQKAFAIDPKAGSTYLDAEHIVILMQENRSFDHAYGTLQGVRGFNDPRAIRLPNKNLVWLQTNVAGQTFAPFRLNIKDTKATWMSSLPHSWTDQVDARNGGKYDKWLTAKPSGNKEYAQMPLTMGHYTREDIPFYYSLADAFTVCDQNFCSSLTGTTPNRLYLWTGTIREKPDMAVKANVRNEDVDYGVPANWTTFPERLEDNGISWKIYQNEISLPTGFTGEEDAWLANFTDNPIEWFTQYHVKYSPEFHHYLKQQEKALPEEIKALEAKLQSLPATGKETEEVQKKLEEKKHWLPIVKEELKQWTPEGYAKLSQREKNLHEKAFTTNRKDPHYRELTTLKYKDGDVDREVQMPKGDTLYQFREDVKNKQLPTVSWIVAPENFSDHPGAPWYGAWYVSEVMDILTNDPEVWKKTIFILAYDENDGYFDHVPPFVPPHPEKQQTGLVSNGIDTRVEHVTMEQELQRKSKNAKRDGRDGPIGLGFRVPLVIASPWSRGGWVNSQVFDHTSVVQFLEKFLSHKTGKKIEETNISTWRRTVCGDLTSVFRPYNGEKMTIPAFLEKDAVIEGIHKARFKKLPSDFKQLTPEEIQQINQNPASSDWMVKQEKGIRPSCALPYQIYSDSQLVAEKKSVQVTFDARKEIFGTASAGVPFYVYASGLTNPDALPRNYAVKAGDKLTDTWSLTDFDNQKYQLQVYGPNGFFRQFSGNANDPLLDIQCAYQRQGANQLTGNVEIVLSNLDKSHSYLVEIKDNSYSGTTKTQALEVSSSKKGKAVVVLDLSKSFGWYDFSVRIAGNGVFEKRYAGRVETGKPSQTDPLMGRVVVS